MALLDVSQKLIFSIIADMASLGHLADIRLVLVVASLVVISIADGREGATAELAGVRPLARVGPLMNLQVATLIKYFFAVFHAAGHLIDANLVKTNELSPVQASRAGWRVTLRHHRLVAHS